MSKSKYPGIYRVWHVRIRFHDYLLGGVPKGFEKLGTEEFFKQLKKGEIETVPEWTTFMQDDEGRPYIEERNIKAMLKEAAATLGYTRGSKSIAKPITRGLFIKPSKITLGNSIDGTLQKPVHVMTRKGPRSVVLRKDFVWKKEIEFDILVASPLIANEQIENMMEVAQEIGLGDSRTQGYGKFKILEFKRIQ